MRRAIVLVGILSLVSLVLLFAAGEILTQSAARRIGPAPADLHATTVVIPTTKGEFVTGWLSQGTPGAGVVLLLHGVRSDRRQMVERARFLGRAGYSTLLIDLPAHGESSGDRITFGARESLGVRAALGFVRKNFPHEPVAVIGVSLGAASFVLAHARPAPDAVVLESMYPTITDAARDRIAIRLGPGGRLLAPLLVWQLPLRIGVSPSALRPIAEIGDLGAPVLIAAGAIDRHTRLEETRGIYAAARAPKALWEVSGAAHVDLHRFAPAQYERVTLAFLRSYMHAAKPRL
jgi:pimeloyl-ACP methyl ester carboxylesterase